MTFVTPHSEATVIGTTFMISVSGDLTRLDVVDGLVRIARKAGGRPVDVAAGRFAVVAEGVDPVAWPLSPPAEQEEPPGGFVEVKVGTAIKRTWEQVKAERFAYGPKQDYDPATGETLVYLPYGNDARLYHRARGILYDPRPGMPAKFHSLDSETGAELTFELRFDRPVGSFRLADGWTEVVLAPDVAAGAEYSVDGRRWVTIRQVMGSERPSGVIEPFIDGFRVAGLDTRTLFLRYYTRDPSDPGGRGADRWIQMWLAGDPAWGDAERTFFTRQIRVWVAPVGAHVPVKEK